MVVKKKSYKRSFNLTSSEVVNINNLLNRRLQKFPNKVEDNSSHAYRIKYGVTLKDGSNLVIDSLDNLFAQKNYGQETIEKLSFSGNVLTGNTLQYEREVIEIIFRRDQIFYEPITLQVSAGDEDWVTETIEILARHVESVTGSPSLFWRISPSALFIVSFFSCSLVATYFNSLSTSNITKLERVQVLEEQWSNETITNTVEIMFELEKIRYEYNPIQYPNGVTLSWIGLIAVLVLATYFSFRLVPMYNFIWGNYKDFYGQRRNLRLFILGSVVLVVILGVGVNIFTTLVGY